MGALKGPQGPGAPAICRPSEPQSLHFCGGNFGHFFPPENPEMTPRCTRIRLRSFWAFWRCTNLLDYLQNSGVLTAPKLWAPAGPRATLGHPKPQDRAILKCPCREKAVWGTANSRASAWTRERRKAMEGPIIPSTAWHNESCSVCMQSYKE